MKRTSTLRAMNSHLVLATASLLGIAGFCDVAAAADDDMRFTIVSPGVAQRPAPETAPGGTVVLRGSPTTNSNTTPAAYGNSGAAYGSTSIGPTVPLHAQGGWDRAYDAGGIDRRYDFSDFNRSHDYRYDTSGFD